MSKLGLIIGRFQPLHKGHSLLIEASLHENPTTLLLIGSVHTLDCDNPYSYESRKSMIQGEFSQKSLSLGALPDFPNDLQWKDCILSLLPKNVTQLTLYCGDKEKDSAVISLLRLKKSLPFGLIVKEIPRSIIPVSATQIRKWIMRYDVENLQKYLGEKTLHFLGITL